MVTFTDINRNLLASDNDVKIDTEVDAINNAITNILLVVKGELPGRPDFGSNLTSYLHEIIDDLTLSAIEDEISNVLSIFEPRIETRHIEAMLVQDELVSVEIEYTVINNGKIALYSNTFEVL